MAQTTLSPTQVNASKRLSRLAAVQALYQAALTERPMTQIVRDFYDHPQALLTEAGVSDATAQPDRELFGAIASGVTDNLISLDEMIASAINPKFSPERLEVLLRAILRAGAYELHHQSATPTGVIINDYVEVAHCFFNAKEPGLVNAMLDKLAKNLRS